MYVSLGIAVSQTNQLGETLLEKVATKDTEINLLSAVTAAARAAGVLTDAVGVGLVFMFGRFPEK